MSSSAIRTAPLTAATYHPHSETKKMARMVKTTPVGFL